MPSCVPIGVAYAGSEDDTAAVPTGVIAPGVSVAGVAVGGMTAAQAEPWIRQSVLGTLTVNVGTQSWTVSATQLGLHAYIARPLRVALAAGRTTAVTPGQDIPVVTRITGNGLRDWLRWLAPQVRTEPIDARFELVKSVPHVVPDQWGRQLDVLASAEAISAALQAARPRRRSRCRRRS